VGLLFQNNIVLKNIEMMTPAGSTSAWRG